MKPLDTQPIALVVTWGKDLIQEKGGLLSFIRYFEQAMADDENTWLQKCTNRPRHEVQYVYIIVCNQVKYRLIYAGHETGVAEVHNGDGISWSSRAVITWPRLVLAGPVARAPRKIPMRGFQGFRYLFEKLF